MDNLPVEIVLNILESLTYKDLLKISKTSKKYNDICKKYKLVQKAKEKEYKLYKKQKRFFMTLEGDCFSDKQKYFEKNIPQDIRRGDIVVYYKDYLFNGKTIEFPYYGNNMYQFSGDDEIHEFYSSNFVSFSEFAPEFFYRDLESFLIWTEKKYIKIVDSLTLILEDQEVFFYIVSFNDNLYLLISQLDINKINYKNQLYREVDYEQLESLLNDVDDYVLDCEDPLARSQKIKEDIILEHGEYKIDKSKIYILFSDHFKYLSPYIEKIKKEYKIKLTGIMPTIYDESDIFDYY